LQGILYGSDLLLGVVLVAELAEEVGVPVRPVQLIEIDMLGLQALQTALQCSGDVLTGEAGGAVTDMVHVPARPGELAREKPRGGTGYISAQSMKLTPASRARSIWAKASRWVFCSPQVMVPRHRALTLSELVPRGR